MRIKSLKRWGLLYGTGASYLVVVNAFPSVESGWITYPVLAAMMFPIMMFFQLGKLKSKEAVQKSKGDSKGSQNKQNKRTENPPRERTPAATQQSTVRHQPVPTLLLMREAEKKPRADRTTVKPEAPADLSDIPLPPGKRKSKYPPSKDLVERQERKKRRLVDEDSIETHVPAAVVPNVTTASKTSAAEPSQHPRKRGQRDEHSLPLFEEDIPFPEYLEPCAVIWHDGEEVYL
jgi:hypothetical protein